MTTPSPHRKMEKIKEKRRVMKQEEITEIKLWSELIARDYKNIFKIIFHSKRIQIWLYFVVYLVYYGLNLDTSALPMLFDTATIGELNLQLPF